MGTFNGDVASTDLTKRKTTEEVLGYFVIFIRSETLKDLCEN